MNPVQAGYRPVRPAIGQHERRMSDLARATSGAMGAPPAARSRRLRPGGTWLGHLARFRAVAFAGQRHALKVQPAVSDRHPV